MNRKKIITANSILMLIAISMMGFTACEKDETTSEAADDNGVNVILPDITGYPIVGTNQTTFFNNSTEISALAVGDAFYGQNTFYPCSDIQKHLTIF
ncbi:MAG: hypothetical protein H8D45_12645 [Bacteroidetes bacterium]|nr:hypothetical protein [Bacteroidota bacterium]MBL7104456.1 hypothetical protein [Bacteroidales bacterium]